MTNDNLSKSNDDAWDDFVNGHNDDLSSIENSRTARKFERKAQKDDKKNQKAQSKNTFRVEDFKSDVFRNNSSSSRTTRGFSTSWLDVEDSGNHFTPPTYDGRPFASSFVIGISAIILGIIGFVISLTILHFNGFVGVLSFILLWLGSALVWRERSSLKAHSSSSSADFGNGSRV